MKYFLLFVALCIAVAIFFFQPVNASRLCYERAQTQEESIQAYTLSRGVSKQSICEQQMDELDTLETCIQDATGSGMVAEYSKDIIPRVVAIIRPYSNNVFTLKEEHNTKCADYSWTLL